MGGDTSMGGQEERPQGCVVNGRYSGSGVSVFLMGQGAAEKVGFLVVSITPKVLRA